MNEQRKDTLWDIQNRYEEDLMDQYDMKPEDILKKMENDPKFYDEVRDFTSEMFEGYEVYDEELIRIASLLYNEGYNVLKRAIEWKTDNPMIVNSLLEERTWNKFANERKIINTRDFLKFEEKMKQIKEENLQIIAAKLKEKESEISKNQSEVEKEQSEIISLKNELVQEKKKYEEVAEKHKNLITTFKQIKKENDSLKQENIELKEEKQADKQQNLDL